jgi:tRNA threonylcarbamoyladenosine biosynthesis protein TsaB
MEDDMGEKSASEPAYALALETSGPLGSAALGRGGDILETRLLAEPRTHARDFLPSIDALCRAHSVRPEMVRRVYVSAGPGSFTGLRIGITAARMIALAGGVQVVAVPTLEVIAQNALGAAEPPEQVAVILDAKRGRTYAALFARSVDGYAATGNPAEVDPRDFLSGRGPGWAVLGEGVACHREAVEASGLRVLPGSLWPPSASTVYRLGHSRAERGEFDDPHTLVPIYVRPPEAEEKWEQRQRGG